MENFAPLMHGFGVALTTYHVALMIVGVLLGILVGVLPGLGAPNGVSLLLPLTFTMDPVSAIILLSSMSSGSALRRIDHIHPVQYPGRTVICRDDFRRLSDGEARKGRRGVDPRVSIGRLRCAGRSDPYYGFVRMGCELRTPVQLPGIFCCLFSGIRQLRGAWSGVSIQDRRLHGPWLCLRGCRNGYQFGRSAPDVWFDEILSGISFLIAVIGLFGIGELLVTMEEGLRFDGISARVTPRDVIRTIATMPRYWIALVRSSIIGCWMGITPGGPTAASFMSYAFAKRLSRRKDHSARASRKASLRQKPPITLPGAAPFCR